MKLNHPNVQRYYQAFEDENEVYVVKENVGGGDLKSRINDLT